MQVNAAFGESAVVFGEQLVNQDYDLFLFAWVGSPDPAGGDTIFQCQETTGEQSQNYTGFCDPEVDELMQQQLETIDPDERSAIYNEADALIAESVPLVPLYQKPAFLAWDTAIQGPQINTTQWGRDLERRGVDADRVGRAAWVREGPSKGGPSSVHTPVTFIP